MSIGEHIKAIRGTKGIKRSELIDKSGVSASQLGRIENGEQKNPTIETLVAIATALNVSIDELVFGQENESSLYLQKAIENLPDEKKKFVKDLIKMAVMLNSSEQAEKNL